MTRAQVWKKLKATALLLAIVASAFAIYMYIKQIFFEPSPASIRITEEMSSNILSPVLLGAHARVLWDEYGGAPQPKWRKLNCLVLSVWEIRNTGGHVFNWDKDSPFRFSVKQPGTVLIADVLHKDEGTKPRVLRSPDGEFVDVSAEFLNANDSFRFFIAHDSTSDAGISFDGKLRDQPPIKILKRGENAPYSHQERIVAITLLVLSIAAGIFFFLSNKDGCAWNWRLGVAIVVVLSGIADAWHLNEVYTLTEIGLAKLLVYVLPWIVWLVFTWIIAELVLRLPVAAKAIEPVISEK